MKTYLVDASVVLKSLLVSHVRVQKEFQKVLHEVTEHKTLVYTTPLIVAEVANGLRFSTRDEAIAQKTIDEFFRLPIKFLDVTQEQWKKALVVSYKQGTTVYDTIYHVVALAIDATFLTCDSAYFKKAKKSGNIQLIS